MDGTAQYTDDIPQVDGELYAALVLSQHAHAEIVSINADKALAMAGVHEFVSAKDLSAKQNKFATTITPDELVFADTHVYCVGMIIGLVLADNQDLAQRAARAVQVHLFSGNISCITFCKISYITLIFFLYKQVITVSTGATIIFPIKK